MKYGGQPEENDKDCCRCHGRLVVVEDEASMRVVVGGLACGKHVGCVHIVALHNVCVLLVVSRLINVVLFLVDIAGWQKKRQAMFRGLGE